ncbi:MAG: carbonic anhydrase family protein [Bacteroidales bacterium]|nr:carbonic anhydrase family protein [Bacteroidales bacterium]
MKKSYLIAIGSLMMLGLVSCEDPGSASKQNNEKASVHEKTGQLSHWSYEGETSPEHWAEIEKNSDCGGKYQSPINIVDVKACFTTADSTRLKVDYFPETQIFDVHNNGHSIQFDFEQKDSIFYKGGVYHLKQVHFHEPSEHTINGMRFPIEIHLVHTNAKNQYTVIGILGIEGNDNDQFRFLDKFLPLKEGETKDINKAFDLKSIFPKNAIDYYSYTGSLTTPPCTENVNWIIYKQPIVLSLDQVLKVRGNMPVNNYRNEQALNNRVICKNF